MVLSSKPQHIYGIVEKLVVEKSICQKNVQYKDHDGEEVNKNVISSVDFVTNLNFHYTTSLDPKSYLLPLTLLDNQPLLITAFFFRHLLKQGCSNLGSNVL